MVELSDSNLDIGGYGFWNNSEVLPPGIWLDYIMASQPTPPLQRTPTPKKICWGLLMTEIKKDGNFIHGLFWFRIHPPKTNMDNQNSA